MSIEQSLDKFKKSSILWVLSIVIPITAIGALNAKGLVDDAQETKVSLKEFQASQKGINDQLAQAINEQKVTNQHLADRLDADDTIIRTLLSSHH